MNLLAAKQGESVEGDAEMAKRDTVITLRHLGIVALMCLGYSLNAAFSPFQGITGNLFS